MFAQSIATFRSGVPFPACFTDDDDTDVIKPGEELQIDPSTYPAVGRYVPAPPGSLTIPAGVRKLAVTKRNLVLKGKTRRELPPIPQSVPPPPPPAPASEQPLLEEGQRNEDEDCEDEVPDGSATSAAPTVPLPQEGDSVSRLVRGPYFNETRFGSLFLDIYYQPPKPKETGETAEQINARIHPPFVPVTHEIRIQRKNPSKSLLYKIGPGAVAFKVVLNTFNTAGMRHTAGNNWNILWAKRVEIEEWQQMSYYQRVNHFPGTWGVGRKDNLHKNISRMRNTHGAAFDFTPATWVLPQETKALAHDMQCHPNVTYIIKPCASSCGKGIRLITKLPQNKLKGSVVQRYIPNPFLVEDRKFDLRLYVAVTGFDPLRIYIFDEGLCRFAAEKYPGPSAKLNSAYAHLTNYSIGKTKTLKSEETKAASTEGSSHEGPRDIKWLLTELKEWFYSRGEEGQRQWEVVARQVEDVVIKTFITIETDVCNAAAKVCRYPNAHGCFELFGFDLMLDSNLKVYVLEANIMPSLATGNPMDKAVKNRLLAHLLTLVGIVPYDRDAAEREEKQRNLHTPAKELGRTCTFINGKVPTGRRRSETKQFFEQLSDCDRRLLIETECELHRAGGFTRVFPTVETWERYSRYFDTNRYRNELLARWEAEKQGERLRAAKDGLASSLSAAAPLNWDIPLPRPPGTAQ